MLLESNDKPASGNFPLRQARKKFFRRKNADGDELPSFFGDCIVVGGASGYFPIGRLHIKARA